MIDLLPPPPSPRALRVQPSLQNERETKISAHPLVLIVEDDEIIAELLLILMMDECGLPHSVITASAEGALDVLRQHDERVPPALILLDFLLLGRLTGGDLLTVLRADPHLRHVPVILMPASRAGERPGVAEAVQKADRTIYKPFEVPDLISAVIEICPQARRTFPPPLPLPTTTALVPFISDQQHGRRCYGE